MSADWKNVPAFMGAVTLVVARIALNLSTDRRQHFVEGEGQRQLEDGLSRFFAETTVEAQPAPVISQYPANGVEFELTINEPFTSLDMVRRFGYESAGWNFSGAEITKPVTKRFKLVPIGAQSNFKAVEMENAKLGIIPDGQWLDAFKKAFSQPDGNGPIGVAKASWVIPRRDACFPYVYTDGGLSFDWTGHGFSAFSRWLVEVQAKA
jgi:hypothetical protein